MKPTKLHLLCAALFTAVATPAFSQSGPAPLETDYFGKLETAPEMDEETMRPKIEIPEPFGNDLFIDGKTNVALDTRSMAARAMKKADDEKAMREQAAKERDRSVRLDLITGQRETILIAPDHYVQVILQMDGEVVKPTNVTSGNEEMIDVKVNVDKSPYIYIGAATAIVGKDNKLINQPTNLFIETEENGRVQTYALRLVITDPKNITDQVILNLTGDRTPPIRGGEGSMKDSQRLADLEQLQMAGSARPGDLSAGSTWSPTGDSAKAGDPGTGHETRQFSRDDTRSYLPTMIQMAKAYDDAKHLERTEGRVIYSDRDIVKGQSGQGSYRDPVSGDVWTIRPWFFPRYDAILLEAVQYNPGNKSSGWNYSLLKARVGSLPGAAGPRLYDITGVSPENPTALPNKGNKIWALVQGHNLTANNEFIPVFPDKSSREEAR